MRPAPRCASPRQPSAGLQIYVGGVGTSKGRSTALVAISPLPHVSRRRLIVEDRKVELSCGMNHAGRQGPPSALPGRSARARRGLHAAQPRRRRTRLPPTGWPLSLLLLLRPLVFSARCLPSPTGLATSRMPAAPCKADLTCQHPRAVCGGAEATVRRRERTSPTVGERAKSECCRCGKSEACYRRKQCAASSAQQAVRGKQCAASSAQQAARSRQQAL